MPTPPFIAELRTLIGTRPLWLSCAIAVVLDDDRRLLLGRRADTGAWALPGGIIDPAEEPADAAVRECFEETGVIAVPQSLTSVSVSPLTTYANGDQTRYLELTFRCTAVGGRARVNDSESLEVAWYPLDALPELDARDLTRLAQALEGGGETAFTFSGLAEVLPPDAG
ncbi:NUDIX hydrolase [Kitasatospora mediocidica]|uniref:NUDIX hydrolase n=1 Tax=Kitasatospora mediocidica TaxID=58352 RepID=UPI000565954E|nr:NUDIX domain-containing protein [Kitasatospora mediocidica]